MGTKIMYNHKAIEKKWREKWAENSVNPRVDDNGNKKQKYYCLDMFPYPSGNGLHVGHWRGYVISDVWSRYKLQQGYYIVHPMGWDAFGLPTENYAIKNHIHPKIVTKSNVHHFKDQLQSLGYSLTGTERSTPPIRSTITGPSGSSSNSSKQVLLTRKKCRSTGVLPVR